MNGQSQPLPLYKYAEQLKETSNISSDAMKGIIFSKAMRMFEDIASPNLVLVHLNTTNPGAMLAVFRDSTDENVRIKASCSWSHGVEESRPPLTAFHVHDSQTSGDSGWRCMFEESSWDVNDFVTQMVAYGTYCVLQAHETLQMYQRWAGESPVDPDALLASFDEIGR